MTLYDVTSVWLPVASGTAASRKAFALAITLSRKTSSSRFLGPSFLMMAATPAQNASGEIPVLGAASLAMKSNRTGAIFNPWASTRFMLGFLGRNGVQRLLFDETQQKTRQKRAALAALLALKPGR